jgi:hypothetical protein
MYNGNHTLVFRVTYKMKIKDTDVWRWITEDDTFIRSSFISSMYKKTVHMSNTSILSVYFV